MASHTPGPWQVMCGRTLNHVETAPDAPAAGVAVCSVPKKDFANARLIAAAPDMFAALELAARSISMHCLGCNVPSGAHSTACVTVRAAIQKAQGAQ